MKNLINKYIQFQDQFPIFFYVKNQYIDASDNTIHYIGCSFEFEPKFAFMDMTDEYYINEDEESSIKEISSEEFFKALSDHNQSFIEKFKENVLYSEKINRDPVPEIGKTYKFYDDGKIRQSRQYNATVKRIITPKEALDIWFYTNKECTEANSLYNIWQKQINEHVQTEGCHICVPDYVPSKPGDPWLYSRNTDYFIECSIPDYDENTIWFVRTVKGTWFSLDIDSCWQAGILDVNGELTKNLEINNLQTKADHGKN